LLEIIRVRLNKQCLIIRFLITPALITHFIDYNYDGLCGFQVVEDKSRLLVRNYLAAGPGPDPGLSTNFGLRLLLNKSKALALFYYLNKLPGLKKPEPKV
jgi:hypothetical protein